MRMEISTFYSFQFVKYFNIYVFSYSCKILNRFYDPKTIEQGAHERGFRGTLGQASGGLDDLKSTRTMRSVKLLNKVIIHLNCCY